MKSNFVRSATPFFVAILFALGLVSCRETKKVKITPKKAVVEVTVGEKVQLEYSVTPAGSKVGFTSMDPAVATVDAEGLVSAVKVGSTKITIASLDGKAQATVAVVVKEAKEISIYPPKGSELPCLIFKPKDEKEKERMVAHEKACRRELVKEVAGLGFVPPKNRVGFANERGNNKLVMAALYGLPFKDNSFMNVALCKEPLDNPVEIKKYLLEWGFGEPSVVTKDGSKALQWKISAVGIGEIVANLIEHEVSVYKTNSMLLIRCYPNK